MMKSTLGHNYEYDAKTSLSSPKENEKKIKIANFNVYTNL